MIMCQYDPILPMNGLVLYYSKLRIKTSVNYQEW